MSRHFRKLEHCRSYASPEVLAAAGNAYNACWLWGYQTNYGNDDDAFYEGQQTYNDAELKFYDAIRRDLGLRLSQHEHATSGSGRGPATRGCSWTAPTWMAPKARIWTGHGVRIS